MFDVIAVVAIGLVGFLAYLLFFERGPRYAIPDPNGLAEAKDQLARWSTVLSQPISALRHWQLIQSGPDLYQHHLKLVNDARRSVHLETYIVEPGPAQQALFVALAARAQAGVTVRVVLDRVGSFKLRRKHLAGLRAAGVQVKFYHPLGVHTFRRLNNRSHRNLLVIDGQRALLGGAGIAQFWCDAQAPWRDCLLQVQGSAVLHLQAVFAENWLESTGEILADLDVFPELEEPQSTTRPATQSIVVGSSPVAGGSSSARILLQLVIATARNSIDLCTPYFIPDRGVRQALIEAARRGVQVRVLTSGPYSDQLLARRAGRRRYGPLLGNGVEIYEYRDHMMHVKSLVIDGQYVVLGSANVDNRSFNLNDEVNVVVDSAELAGQVNQVYEDDLSHSDQVTLQAWQQRSWIERLLASLGRGLERHD